MRYTSSVPTLPPTQAFLGRPLTIPPAALHTVLTHVVRHHPKEACGVLLARVEQPEVIITGVALDNIHAHEPAGAFEFHEGQHLALLRWARAQGLVERVFYHSHVEAPAVFSRADQDGALWEGTPRFPGVDHLVIGTRHGKPVEARLYGYDKARGRFVEMQANPHWQQVDHER